MSATKSLRFYYGGYMSVRTAIESKAFEWSTHDIHTTRIELHKDSVKRIDFYSVDEKWLL